MHDMIFGNYALKHISTFVMLRVVAHISIYVCWILLNVTIQIIIIIVTAGTFICCFRFIALLHNQKLHTKQIPAENYKQHSSLFMQ